MKPRERAIILNEKAKCDYLLSKIDDSNTNIRDTLKEINRLLRDAGIEPHGKITDEEGL